MASTKKKRQTKHRGNAAGFVETRGRTGRNRPVSDAGKSGKGGSAARQSRANRFSKPPSWSSAAQRAVIAVAIFVVLAIVALHQKPAAAIALGGFMVLLYTPMGYYMDTYFYKRRQAQAAAGGGKAPKR
jgi:hypothetical protein